MEKRIKLSLILMLIVICFAGAVFAVTPNCNVILETAKTEYSKNEEITVDVKISNIQSDRGFIALEANLDYDKDSLTLVDMKGQNDWVTPIKDLSYNEATGKIVIDKNGLAKSDEIILRLIFKANENTKQNATVALKDIRISDGTGSVKIDRAPKSITIKEGQNTPEPTPTPTPDPKPTPEPEPTPTPTPNPDTSKPQTPTINNNGNNENKPTVKIPQAGENNTVLIVLGTVAVVVGVVCFIKMKVINK